MTALLSTSTLERLARLEFGLRGIAGGGRAGERLAGAAGTGTLFREHRAYSSGDDLRYVDWNAFGRLGAFHVKVFEAEESVDLHLLVDRSASMGQGAGSKLHTAMRVAAALGTVGLAHGATVRAQAVPAPDDQAASATGVGTQRRAFRGRRATADLHAFLHAMPGGGRRPLGRALRPAFPRLRRRGLAVLLTDFLDDPAGPDGWRRAVDFLRHRRVRLVGLHVVAPEERDPGVLGAVRLVDSEGGGDVHVDVDERLRAAYRARFERHLDEVGAYLREREARHVVVDTALTDADLLRRLLASGLLR